MTETEAREELRRAVEAHHAVLEKMRKAERSAERGRELLDYAEEELARYSDLPERILEYRKSAARTWTRLGGAKPSTELPPDLEQAQRAAAAATEQVAVARAVYDSLMSEATPARVVAAAFEKKARLAAIAVMKLDEERLAEQAAKAMAEAARCLCAMDSYHWIFSAEERAEGITTLRSWDLAQTKLRQGVEHSSDPAATRRWRDYWDALMTDPEALMPTELMEEPTT